MLHSGTTVRVYADTLVTTEHIKKALIRSQAGPEYPPIGVESESEFLIKVAVNPTFLKSGDAIHEPFRMSSTESGMDSLLSSLASLERKFKEHEDMNITDEEANAAVRRVVDAIGVGTSPPTGVAFAPVHTYVHQLDKTPKPWSSSIVVPPFACHWGIVVGPPERQTLFHLLFVDDVGRQAESSTVENKNIQFHYARVGSLANTQYVGQTRYHTDQLVALGDAMIREFGSYHRLFWNCQTFAKCYLRVITGDHEAKFDNWTSADTSRLFLCAFLVGTPFATTNKVKENLQAERLIRKIESIPEQVTTEDQSAQTIAAIYEALKQDPSWGSKVGKLEDMSARPGFFDQLLKRLFGKD